MRPPLALTIAVLVAWACLHRGALGYVWQHPDTLGWPALPQALKALARLAAAAWLLAAASGVGRAALRPMLRDFSGEGERRLLEAGLGLGLLSHLLFLMGLLHLWTPAPLLVLGGLLCVPAWPAARSWRAPSLPALTWPQALFALPVILAALCAFTGANAPPTEWDSLAVHLEIPRQYAKLGALAPLRWLSHGFDPMAAEMLYVPALVFKSAELPAMAAFLLEALMAAGIWVCGRRLFGGTVALAAAALFLCQPAVSHVSGTPGTDFGVGLFAMLAFWSAWRGTEAGQGRWLILSGAFAGLAAVSKTTGVFLAAALGLALAVRALSGRRYLWRWLAAWAAAALLLSLPWFLRTFLYTGNPIWPYMPALFGGGPRDFYIFARARNATLEGLGTGWRELLFLPLNLVFNSESFRHSARLLMIPLFVLGLSDWRSAVKEPFARFFVGYAAAFAVLWFFAVQNWRYFIPLMPWLCLLACAWAARCWRQGGWDRLLAASLAAGFLGLPEMSANNALFPVLGLRSQNPGLTSEQAYLRRSVSSYEAMELLNRDLPAGGRVLLYREVRPFYLERDYLIGDPQNEMLIRYEELRTPDELYRRLRELGVAAVLLDPRLETFSPWVPGFMRSEAMLREVLARRAAPPAQAGGALVYAWKGS